jgi:predicted PurR-regulated permease PerM
VAENWGPPPSSPDIPVAPVTVEDAGAAQGRGLRFFGGARRFAKLWGFALFCVFVVYFFRDVALPFVFAILVAYVLAPLVDRMAKLRVGGRPFPRGLAVILLYINILAVLGLFIGYFIPKLSGDIARVFREAPELFKKLDQEYLPRIGGWVDDTFGAGAAAGAAVTPAAAERVPPPAPVQPPGLILEPMGDGRYRIDLTGLGLEVMPNEGGYLIAPPKPPDPDPRGEGRWERSLKQWIAERIKSTESQSRRAIEWGQKAATGVITGIARLILVLMVAAFILIDLQRIRAFLRSLMPEAYRTDYDHIARGIDRGLSGVVRGQLLICLINGIFTYVGLLIFQVKYPLLLAGIAAVMSLVPIFGSILSSVPIVAIALVSSGRFDLLQGIKVTGWIIAIHLVEANYLNPKIMGDAAKIHPVLVVFALIAGEHSYGLVGALFAVPVASIIQTLFTYFRRKGRPSSATSTTMPAVDAITLSGT